MQTVMFDYFHDALRDYLKFLLGFILRDVDIRESKVIEEIKNNPKIRLNPKVSHMAKVEPGHPVNDI